MAEDFSELDSMLQEAEAMGKAQKPIDADPEKSKRDEALSFVELADIQDQQAQKSAEGTASLIKGAAIGGMQAIEGAGNLIHDVANAGEDWLASVGIGSGDLIDENSQLEVIDKIFGEPKNKSEQGGRLIGQYLMPFLGITKITKGAGIVKAGKDVLAASVLSGAIIDPDDERLADVVENVPVLGPLVSALRSNPDDSKMESRLKNMVESVLVDTATLGGGTLAVKGFQKAAPKLAETFAKAVKATGKARSAKDEVVTGAKKVVDEAKLPVIDQVKVDEIIKSGIEGKSVKEISEAAKKAGRPLSAEELFIVFKRGKISDKQAMKNAQAVVGNREKLNEAIQRKVGKLANQEELLAMQTELEVNTSSLRNAMDNVRANPESKEAQLLFLEADDTLSQTFASMEGGFSEGGRLLRTKQLVTDAGGKDRKAIAEYMKLKGGDEGIAEKIGLWERALKLADDADLVAKMSNPKKTKGDALFEVVINGMLAGPDTHFTNIVSNAINIPNTAAELQIMEWMNKAGLSQADEVVGQTHAFYKGLSESVFDALENSKAVFNGTVPKGNVKIPHIKDTSLTTEVLGDNILGRFLQQHSKVINIPGRLLNSEDAFFRTMNYAASARVQAHQEALLRGVSPGTKEYGAFIDKMTKNPSEAIGLKANQFADANIFTKSLDQGIFAGRVLKGIEQTLDAANIGSVPVGRFFAPFIRISGNLTDYTLQRVPGFGLLSPEMRRMWNAGGVEKDQALARMIYGGGVMTVLGSTAVYSGVLTGSGPADNKLKKAIGYKEDRLGPVTLNSLGPMGALLKITADASDLMTKLDADQDSFGNDLMVGSMAIVGELLTPTVMTDNLPNLLKIVKSIGQSEDTSKEMSKQLAKLSANLVPGANFWRQARKIQDPTKVYDTYVGLWDEMKKEFLRTVPIAGFGDMPPQRNIFGEEVYYPPGLGQAIGSAIFSNKEQPDQTVENEIVRLEMDGKVMKARQRPENAHLNTAMPPKSIRRGGFTTDLTPKEYDRYVKLAAGIGTGGPSLRERLHNIITDPAYEQMSDQLKRIQIRDVISEMRINATQAMKDDENINQRLDRLGRTHERSLRGE